MRVLNKQEWQLVEKPLEILYGYFNKEWNERFCATNKIGLQLIRWNRRYTIHIHEFPGDWPTPESPPELITVVNILTKLNMEEEAQELSNIYNRNLDSVLEAASYVIILQKELEPKKVEES